MSMKPQNTDQELQKDTAIEVAGFDKLREHVNNIPDGTIYSVDLSEVIRIGQDNG